MTITHSMRFKIITMSLVLISAIGWTTSLFAQEGQTQITARPQGSRYFLGGQDDILMQVNVWGLVRRPGQYMVPYDTDLVNLLSYAGGPLEDAKMKNVKVIRPATGENKSQVIKVDVKKFINTGDISIIPKLEPGDTIVVSATAFHHISRFFEFVSRVMIIAQIIALIEYYTTR